MNPGSLLLRLLLSLALVGNGLLPAATGMQAAATQAEPVAKTEVVIEQAEAGDCHGTAPESSAPESRPAPTPLPAPVAMPAHPHAAQDAGTHSMPCCPDPDMTADCRCDCLHASAIALAVFEFIGAAPPEIRPATRPLVADDAGPADMLLRPPIFLG